MPSVANIPQPTPTADVVLTPPEMLNRAMVAGASPETLAKFMDLYDRWEQKRERKEFDAAIAAAKAEIRPIVRDSTGHNSKKYVSLDAIAKAVDPILSKHGLAYRFRTEQTDRINVTCILFGYGHSEESTLSGPPDTTGNKNAIQAIGSTLSYLQRYSLVQMLGLAAANDDDGAGSGAGGSITDEQAGELLRLIEATSSDIRLFCRHFKVEGVALLPANQFDRAKQMLAAKVQA